MGGDIDLRGPLSTTNDQWGGADERNCRIWDADRSYPRGDWPYASEGSAIGRLPVLLTASDLLVRRPLCVATQWTPKRGAFADPRRCCSDVRPVSEAIHRELINPISTVISHNDPLNSAGKQA